MKYSFTKEGTNLIMTLDTESGKYAPQVSALNDPNITLENDFIWFYENGKNFRYLSFLEIGLIDGVAPTNIANAFSLLNVVVNSLKSLASPKFKGSVIPTDTPQGTEDAFWIATQAGTYTFFGNFALPANSRAEISRVGGVFTNSITAFDITSKVNVSDVVNNLTSTSTVDPVSALQAKLLNEKFVDYAKTTDLNGFLKSTVINQTSLVNLNGYILKDGTNNTDVNWKHSDYLNCEVGDTFDLNVYGHTSVNSISFYDVNQSFISGAGLATTNPYIATIIAPANTVFFRLCFGSLAFSGYNSQVLIQNNSENGVVLDLTPYAKTEDLTSYATLVNLEESTFLSVSENFWDLGILVGHINTSGDFVGGDTNWASTNFIPIGDLTGLSIKIATHSALNFISFYDANNIFISGISGEPFNIITGNYNFPANTAFFRLSSGSDTFVQYQTFLPYYAVKIGTPTETTTIKDKVIELENKSNVGNIFKGKKIVLFGDSRMSNDYSFIKQELKEVTGAEIVLSNGMSGQSIYTIADNIQTTVIAENPDFVIGLFGGNDLGQFGYVGTFSENSPLAILGEPVVADTLGYKYIQDTSRMVQSLKTAFYNIRQRANLTGNETELERTAKIEAVKKVKCLFLTDLPQKRVAPDDAFSNPVNWERKRLAVIEACEKHKMPYLDLQSVVLKEWDFTLEPTWSAPTDKINNNGIMTMDGLHTNRFGFRFVSKLIKSKLESMGN